MKTIVEIDTEDVNQNFIPRITDDGTLICSSFEEGCCWVFSTLHVNNFGNSNNGSHPVSGNRQFGLKNLGNGKYEFYIKAADRARISWVASLLASITLDSAVDIFFQITDKSWNNLTNNITNKINNSVSGDIAGIAVQNAPITVRPIWKQVKDKLKSQYPLTSIPCDE